MQNIIAGAIVGIIFILSLYFSIRGDGSSCSSCSDKSSCHSKSCKTDLKNKNKNSDLKGLL